MVPSYTLFTSDQNVRMLKSYLPENISFELRGDL